MFQVSSLTHFRTQNHSHKPYIPDIYHNQTDYANSKMINMNK